MVSGHSSSKSSGQPPKVFLTAQAWIGVYDKSVGIGNGDLSLGLSNNLSLAWLMMQSSNKIVTLNSWGFKF